MYFAKGAIVEHPVTNVHELYEQYILFEAGYSRFKRRKEFLKLLIFCNC